MIECLTHQRKTCCFITADVVKELRPEHHKMKFNFEGAILTLDVKIGCKIQTLQCSTTAITYIEAFEESLRQGDSTSAGPSSAFCHTTSVWLCTHVAHSLQNFLRLKTHFIYLNVCTCISASLTQINRIIVDILATNMQHVD